MAAPAALGVVKVAAKKLIFDVFTDPEKIFKYIAIVFVSIISALLLIVLPVVLLASIPVILFTQPNQPQEVAKNQLDTIGIYQYMPIKVNKQTMDWVEQKKIDNSDADKVVTQINFSLTWQMIMAIDAVRIEQDFNDVKEDEVLSIANKFIYKNVKRDTYQVQETYTEEIIAPDGKTYEVTRTRPVTKKRATITIRTKSIDEVINELGFSAVQKEAVHNMFNTMSGYDAEGNYNYDMDVSELKEYPPGNANIPYFNQYDKRWANYSYGRTGTIRSSGCGPTSLAMVVAGLTGRSDINPKVVADWSYANGHKCEGSGSYWSLITAGGRYYGLDVEAVSRKNPKKIVDALSKGYPVIVSMGPGHFTDGGHFLVLRGLTEDGKIMVNDSGSYSRTQKTWDIPTIMSESSTLDGPNGCPFWILKNKGDFW